MTTRRWLLAVIALIVGVGPLLAPTKSAGADPASRAYANSQFLDLRGVRTHVQVWEPVGDPLATVVSMHHFYGSAQTFDAFGRLLADEGVRVIAFDRAGFGLTERIDPKGRFVGPDAPYTRAFAAEQLVELLDHFGIERAIIQGTSMGGTTAVEFAAAHPDRVLHLVPTAAPLTADASAPSGLRPLLRTRWVTGIASAVIRRKAPQQAGRDRVAGAWLDPSKATDADVEAHLGFIGVQGWDTGLWWKLTSDITPNLPPLLRQLPSLGVPVTAVGGTHDPIIATKYVRMLAELAGGTSEMVRCGHVVQQECPEGLARIILDLV